VRRHPWGEDLSMIDRRPAAARPRQDCGGRPPFRRRARAGASGGRMADRRC